MTTCALEAFRKTHGDNVARVVLRGVDLSNKVLLAWARGKANQGTSRVVSHRSDPGRISLFMNNVDDLQTVADLFPWESTPHIDADRKAISGKLQVPAEIESYKLTPRDKQDKRRVPPALGEEQVDPKSRLLTEDDVLDPETRIFALFNDAWNDCEVVESLPQDLVYVHKVGMASAFDEVISRTQVRMALDQHPPADNPSDAKSMAGQGADRNQDGTQNSPLVGGTGGNPFRDEDPDELMIGVSMGAAKWRGQMRLSSIRPLFNRDRSHLKNEAIAPEGYAVGAIRVAATEVVNGVQLIYMKVKDDGSLDPANTRESKWFGKKEGAVGLASGKGQRLCGLLGRKSTVVDALGVVMAADK